MYDVTIYDSVGLGVSHKLYDTQGLGGSEFQQLLLAESLAEAGFKVLYLSKNTLSNHVDYQGNGSIDYQTLHTNFKTNNLIIVRNSKYDWKIGNFKKVFVWSHDTNYGNLYNDAHGEMFANIKATLLCVSDWQKKLFDPLNWNTLVVYNSIPDFVFDYKLPEKKKQFIYASAAWKGLQQTVGIFNQLKNNNEFKDFKLKILSPGYENFNGQNLSNNDIEWIGSVKFDEVVKYVAESYGLLYYNTMAETYGIVPVLAASLKTVPLIYQSDNTWYSGGALTETVGSKFVANNFNDYVKLIFNHKSLKENLNKINYQALASKKAIFANRWKSVLDLYSYEDNE